MPAAYISACAGIVLLLAALLQPFMPSFTAKLLQQLGASEARAQPLPAPRLASPCPARFAPHHWARLLPRRLPRAHAWTDTRTALSPFPLSACPCRRRC